jgi:hypothetical protein
LTGLSNSSSPTRGTIAVRTRSITATRPRRRLRRIDVDPEWPLAERRVRDRDDCFGDFA